MLAFWGSILHKLLQDGASGGGDIVVQDDLRIHILMVCI